MTPEHPDIESDRSLLENGKLSVEIKPTISSSIEKKLVDKYKVSNFNISTYLSKYFYW